MTGTDTHRAIDAVWRIESARLIAGLARMVGDIGQAEDLAQDALLIALEKWPESLWTGLGTDLWMRVARLSPLPGLPGRAARVGILRVRTPSRRRPGRAADA